MKNYTIEIHFVGGEVYNVGMRARSEAKAMNTLFSSSKFTVLNYANEVDGINVNNITFARIVKGYSED